MQKKLLCALAGASIGLLSYPARAAEAEPLAWLPGDAREISRSSSASRDTAALEAIVAPRFSVTLGTELGILRWKVPGVAVRVGALALFGLESRTPSQRLLPAPGGDSDLWRGILAYEISGSFDRFAARELGRHGALELAIGYYHESDHHTASNAPLVPGAPPDHPELRARPQVGNFVSADLAVRFQLRVLEVVLRQQAKLFANGAADRRAPFVAGTGNELVLQLHELLRPVIAFSATSIEVLVGRDRAPARYFRTLLGVSLPGVRGDLRLYASCDAGAGKGLLIPQNATALGAGLRYTPFVSDWR